MYRNADERTTRRTEARNTTLRDAIAKCSLADFHELYADIAFFLRYSIQNNIHYIRGSSNYYWSQRYSEANEA